MNGDREFMTLFSGANHLHTNFYEGWLDRSTVIPLPWQVTRFIDKVEALLP